MLLTGAAGADSSDSSILFLSLPTYAMDEKVSSTRETKVEYTSSDEETIKFAIGPRAEKPRSSEFSEAGLFGHLSLLAGTRFWDSEMES